MFKIIHTSDWHLGQHFFTRQRKREHEQFLQWLVQQVTEHRVDAVIVAGDIYDTGTPPSYARELYNQFVLQIQALNCQLILLAGNHDSVSVLNESKSILKQLNTDVVSRVDDDLAQQLLLLRDKNNQPGAVLAAIPFIRAADLVSSQAGESGTQKRQNLGEAIAAHYQRLFVAAQNCVQQQESPIPIIMTGHLAAVGVSQSESVRDIYIGSLDGFAVSAFPPADYIALGHIHRPQCLNNKTDGSIFYSGSPIPLSFDELKHPKTVNLVGFEQGKLKSVDLLEIPTFQAMHTIKGDLSEIEAQIAQLPKDQSIWLSVKVTSQDFLSDLQERIAAMTHNSLIEVLQLTRSRQHSSALQSGETMETLSELTPMEVFERRLALVDLESEEDQQKMVRLKQHFTRIEQDIVLESTPSDSDKSASWESKPEKNDLQKNDSQKTDSQILDPQKIDVQDNNQKDPF